MLKLYVTFEKAKLNLETKYVSHNKNRNFKEIILLGIKQKRNVLKSALEENINVRACG
jgi:hypothetical protein